MNRIALLVVSIASTALAQHPITFEDLAAIHRVGAPQPSPDGQWVAYDASTPDLKANKSNSAIYLIAAGGGASRQLTEGSGPVWSPDGKSIAYVSSREGGVAQAYLYDLATKQSRKATSLQGGAGSVKWMPDGSGLVVVSDVYPDCGVDPSCIRDKTTAEGQRITKTRVINRLLYRHWKSWQEPTRTHIVYVPLKGGSPRDLTPGAFDAPPFSIGGGDEFDVSADGRELIYARDTEERPEISTNSDLFAVPITGGEAIRLTTRRGADTSPKYSPDGRWIAWRSQARAGYESDLWELWLYDRSNGQTRRLLPNFDNWIESIAWAPDSKSIYITAPMRGETAIYEARLDGGLREIHTVGGAGNVAVSADGKRLYFDWSTLTRPEEVYALTPGGALTQLTHDNDALMHGVTVGETTSITWTGAGGQEIQGYLVKPPQFDPSRKYPALVLIHGGPQGMWGNAWSYRWNPQIFASRGYVILMPNPRGSSGFGQKFVEEISGDWGGRAFIDIMNGAGQLGAMTFVDPTRLGAAGGSFGGYMVDWILGHSNAFKALVSHSGVYNLESMYGVTEELWFPEWEFGGTPWDHPELYEKWSPHRYAKNFKTPTLVSHGELDFRVPIGEGLQLFTALQRRGVPSKLLYFPDEGHWILKPQNSRLWYQTVGDWFDQWLKTK